MPLLLPQLKIRIRGQLNRSNGERILGGRNPSGPTALFEGERFSTLIPGGFGAASFTVPDVEVGRFANAYTTDAEVTILIDRKGPRDQVVYHGFMKQPPRDPRGKVSIECMGYHQWLHDREEPMLWQTGDISEDWQSGDDPPMGFNNSDAIDLTLGKAMLTWRVAKGAEMKGGAPAGSASPADRSRAGLWAYGHNVRRIAASLHQNRDMPGGAARPAFGFRLEKYDSASQPSTDAGVIDADLASAILTAGVNSIDVVLGKPKPMVVFNLWRKTDSPSGGVTHSFKVWLENLRANGDAYRGTPGSWDTYPGDEMFKDVMAKFGVAVGTLVSSTLADSTSTFGLLPLWWHDSNWYDLCDYLATHYMFKWAIWEPGVGPEFGPWNSSWTKTWKVKCYGPDAFASILPRPTEHMYSHVDVSFQFQHKRRRTHHIIRPITPNPFAGLPGPVRARTYRFHLRERVRTDALPITIANYLASQLSTVQQSATVGPTSYLLDSNGAEHSCLMARAGDLLNVDFPGGSQTLRVHETDYDPSTGGTTFHCSHRPISVKRLLWAYHRKMRRRGKN